MGLSRDVVAGPAGRDDPDGRSNPRWAGLAVEDRLFRALAVLRVIVLLNAIALNIYRADSFQRPVVGWVAVGVMVTWTVVAGLAYRAPARRDVPLLAVDLVLAVSLLALSPVIKGADFQASVPGFWVMAALLAWAVRFGWTGGLIAGVALGATDLLSRIDFTQNNYGNVFLLVIGGPIVGYMSQSLQRMAAERDLAERAAAAAAERARLARAVHDGVLQVLALVQRRGAEIGGPTAELGRLAGDQESALRTLIRAQDAVRATADPASREATVDLASRLSRLSTRSGIHVAVPGGAVELPSAVAEEILGVVGACLDNVARHVGEDAPCWVLLEAMPERVELSVRDEGPGIPVGRLDVAADEGRLGVSESIRGRIRDLDGTAELSTGEFGTEWEFTIPR